jgi:hypothetical protein
MNSQNLDIAILTGLIFLALLAAGAGLALGLYHLDTNTL